MAIGKNIEKEKLAKESLKTSPKESITPTPFKISLHLQVITKIAKEVTNKIKRPCQPLKTKKEFLISRQPMLSPIQTNKIAPIKIESKNAKILFM